MRFWQSIATLFTFFVLAAYSVEAVPTQQIFKVQAGKEEMADRPYAIVIGGSYTGWRTVENLVTYNYPGLRVLMIEQHSHFEHIFAFPRFSVATGVETRKAFIPFTPGPFYDAPEGFGKTVQARVIDVTKHSVVLDKKVEIDGEYVQEIPYSYLFVATGTRLTPPSMLPFNDKLESVSYLAQHAARVKQSKRIVLIGGGAVGVQSSLDIRELYPNKEVTLIHSRNTTMNHFDPRLHDIVMHRAKELKVNMMLGTRVKIPLDGYPTDGKPFEVELVDGRKVETDMAIVCIGQTPQSDLIRSLSPASVNAQGYVKVKKTLQIDDPNLPNVFVYGDVGETGAHKSGRGGWLQSEVAVKNLGHLLDGTELEEYHHEPPGIYLSLGIKQGVAFSNSATPGGSPNISMLEIGHLDHNIERIWRMRHGGDDYDA